MTYIRPIAHEDQVEIEQLVDRGAMNNQGENNRILYHNNLAVKYPLFAPSSLDKRFLEKELQIGEFLNDVTLRAPQMYFTSETESGMPYLVMERLREIKRIDLLQKPIKQEAEQQYSFARKFLKEIGFDILDTRLNKNCGWLPSEKRVVFYDFECWNYEQRGSA